MSPRYHHGIARFYFFLQCNGIDATNMHYIFTVKQYDKNYSELNFILHFLKSNFKWLTKGLD